MPQINILPIENTQLPEVKDVSEGGRSRNSEEFGRHMVQEDSRQKRDDDKVLRSNSAANSGNSSQKTASSSTVRASDNDKPARRSDNSSVEGHSSSHDKSVDENKSQSTDKNVDVADEASVEPTNDDSSTASNDKKVTPDILLSVLGASEKVLVNKDVNTTDNPKESADKSGTTSSQLVGIDERLKALVTKVERPDNSIDADYVSPIAALRRGDSKGENTKTELSGADQAMKNQATGKSLEKAATTNSDSVQMVEVSQQESVKAVKEAAATQASEENALEIASKEVTAKTGDANSKEDNNKKELTDKKSTAIQSVNVKLVSDKESSAADDSSKPLSSNSELPDDINMQERTVAASNSVDNSKVKLDSPQPKVVETANDKSQPKHQINPVSQAVAESLDTEKNIEKVAHVTHAPAEKVGQSSNSAQNHTRYVNQSTQDAVQVSESSADSASQEQSDQQTDAKAFAQKEMVLNHKNGEQSNIADKGTADTARTNERGSMSQSQYTNSVSSTDAAVLDKVMDKLSSEQTQTSNVRNGSQVASETLNMHRKDFVDQVKDKVMVMINKRLQQLEIRLDPAELGSMQVKLNMQNEQAAVSIVVQNSQAKEALDQNIQKLRDMLQESGVDVGDANIEHRETSEQQEFAQSRGEDKHHPANGEDEQRAENITSNLYKASSTGIDYYA